MVLINVGNYSKGNKNKAFSSGSLGLYLKDGPSLIRDQYEQWSTELCGKAIGT